MKRLTQVAMLIGVFLLGSPISYACFCAEPPVMTAFNQARAVFVGEVLEVLPPRSTEKNGGFVSDAHTIRFKVEKTWKGDFFGEAEVSARWNNCFGLERAPEKGERYLVYAEPVYPNDKARKEVFISSCTRTALMTSISVEGFSIGTPDDDIRMLDSLMIFSPRKNTATTPWMTFLTPSN